MAWDSSLNKYGLTAPAPVSQITPLAVMNTYSSGSLPAGSLSGQITNQLQVGGNSDPNVAVYIDYQGIYAGNAVFSQAPFSVDQHGNIVANNGSFSGNITASAISGSTITGGSINGTTITGSTVVGGLIETALTNQRVAINEGNNNAIRFYDSTGTLEGALYGANGGTADAGVLLQGVSKVLLAVSGSPADIVVNNVGVVVFTPLVVNDNIGFYGTPAQPQPTVTGSLGGNAALASLITSLATLGLVVDGTTP